MSTLDLVWVVPVMIAFLALKGFFSGSEIALVSADKLKLSHRAKQGDAGAKLISRLFKRPERLLTTTLIGTNIATIVLTTLGTLMMIHFVGNEAGDLYSFIVLTPLLLILGEIVPKGIFQQRSNELARLIIFPLQAFAWLFAPLVFVFSRVARFAAWLVGQNATSQHLFMTREQLRSVMDMAERATGATVFDRFRIERATRFSSMTVGEQMIPVGEIVAIDSEKTTERAIRLVRRKGLNRIPVYKGDTNNVVGVITLNAWDLLDPEIHQKPFADLIQPAHYVSPHDSLMELMPVLRERDDQLAIVVDEYGSTIGMITMEDAVEAVVGEIDIGFEFEDYLPKPIRKFTPLDGGGFLMDGRLLIHEVNDVLGLNLATTEFHTLGGMLIARLHHLASPGESIVESGYRFTVEEATERVIKKVRVEREAFHAD